MSGLGSESDFDLSCFKEASILGIIRGASPGSVQGILDACISGGLKFVELTLNSERALPSIELASKEFSGGLCIGAGTVLSLSDTIQAVNAGAQFIVSPTLNVDVASYCGEKGLAYFPGALTPTEIEKSWNAGATMVKVFPASQMGPDYFKTVRGPFDKLLLMAVGGIKVSDATKYLQAGASAVAIGGSVFTPSRIKNKEFESIKSEISKFVSAIKMFYSGPQ